MKSKDAIEMIMTTNEIDILINNSDKDEKKALVKFKQEYNNESLIMPMLEYLRLNKCSDMLADIICYMEIGK